MSKLTEKDIQNWLTYWQNAGMVAVDNIFGSGSGLSGS